MKQERKFLIATISLSLVTAISLLYYRTPPTSIFYALVAVGVIVAGLENIIFHSDIIRDRYTKPGIAFGIIASAIIPSLQGEQTPMAGAMDSALWAVLTYGLLTLFVEIESRYSGPRSIELEAATAFKWSRFTGVPTLALGSELFLWSDLFNRDRDEVRIECESATVDSSPITSAELVFRQDKLFIGARRYLLADVSDIRGYASHLSLPREAIGLGAIKAMAAFSALLGWKASLFIFVGAAIISTALRTPLLRRSITSNTVPLMPFLAAAALIWMFCGPELIAAYFSFASRK